MLCNLQEAELGPATAVWTSALQVLTALPGVWDYVSPGKAVLPPVYKLMEAGGRGLAVHTFSNLMPFLSRVPASVLAAEDNKVVERWLTSLYTGLGALQENKKAGRGELEAVAEACLECSMLILNMEDVNQELKLKVLEEHLLDGLVIKSLTDKRLSEGGLYKSLRTFLGAFETKEAVAKLNSLFWARLTHFCVEAVGCGDISSVTLMLSTLNSPSNKISSVKMVICKLWGEMVGKLRQHLNTEVETTLVTLNNMSNLVRKCDLKRDTNLVSRLFQSESKERFLKAVVIPLLEHESLVEAVTSLLLTIMSLMEDEESASEILVSASLTVNSDSVIKTLLSQFSQHPDSPLYRPWLNHTKIRQFMVEYLIKVEQQLRHIDREPPEYRGSADVVCSMLETNLEVTDEELEAVLTKFKAGLEETHKLLRPYTDFISRVCKLLTPLKGVDIWSRGVGAEVAYLMFQVDFGQDREYRREDVWLCGCLNSDTDSDLWTKMMEHINCLLELDNMCMEDLSILTTVCIKLFDNRELIEFVELIRPLPVISYTWSMVEEVLDQRIWVTSNELEESVIPDAKLADLRGPRTSLLLCKMILEKCFPDNEEPENLNDTVPDSARVNVDTEVIQYIVQITHSYSYLSKVTERAPSHVNGISLQEELDKCLRSVVTRLGRTSYNQLREKLLEASLEAGGLATVGLVWLVRTVYATSEWDPRLSSLLPLRYTWSGPEVTHTASVLHLASDLGSETEAIMASTTDLITASLISVEDGWSTTSDSLLWLLAECVALTPRGRLESITEHLASVMILIQAATADTKEQLLYNRSLAGVRWEEAARVASLARFLAVTISKTPEVLPPELWDLACCSLVSWASSLEESVNFLSSVPASLVTSTVCQLASAVGRATSVDSSSSDSVPQKLKYEWEEFFAEGVYSVLVPVFVSLATGVLDPSASFSSASVLKQLSAAVTWCPPSLLMEVQVPALHLVQDVDMAKPLPDTTTFLYNHLGPLLLAPCRHVQVAASLLLGTVAKNTKEKEEEEDDEETREIPRRLEEVIKQGDKLLDTILQEFKIGEAAGPIPPGNAAHTVTMGYLLAWRVVLALLEAAGDEQRPKYTEYLKTRGYLDSLMGHLFRVLPKSPTPGDREMFLAREVIVISGSSAAEIRQLSGSTWMAVCRHLPAVARTWWRSLDKVMGEYFAED